MAVIRGRVGLRFQSLQRGLLHRGARRRFAGEDLELRAACSRNISRP